MISVLIIRISCEIRKNLQLRILILADQPEKRKFANQSLKLVIMYASLNFPVGYANSNVIIFESVYAPKLSSGAIVFFCTHITYIIDAHILGTLQCTDVLCVVQCNSKT